MVRNHEVRGSIPLFSTTSRRAFWFAVFLYLKIRLHFIGYRSFFDQSKLWSIITPAAQLGNAAHFREKSRLLRLCVCKRTHDAFTALSTFLGYAPSFLLFHKKVRSARLFVCKRTHNGSLCHYCLFESCACGAFLTADNRVIKGYNMVYRGNGIYKK